MELDSEIQQKRTDIREAFAAHQRARKAAAQMHHRLAELQIAAAAEGKGSDPESLRLAEAQALELESAEQNAAMRFNAISKELADLHRQKYGFWHITWTGPRLPPLEAFA